MLYVIYCICLYVFIIVCDPWNSIDRQWKILTKVSLLQGVLAA